VSRWLQATLQPPPQAGSSLLLSDFIYPEDGGDTFF
jgi:hypothetical protein